MNHDTDSHPSEARLVAYLDGELDRDERAVVSRHLPGCAVCSRTMAELRRTAAAFSEAVDSLQPPPSEATAGQARRRAAGRHAGPAETGAAAASTEDGGDSPFGMSTATRIAASLVVLLGAAAALPGSPVRSWIDASVQQVQAIFGGEEKPPAAEEIEEPGPDRPDVEDRSGVAVSASGGSISITLSDVPRSTSIQVRLVHGPEAGVWNAGGAYRTAPGRIEVTAPASDALLVEMPRPVSRVRLEVNGRLVAVKRDGVLDVRIPDVEVRDGEFTFRTGTN